MRKATLLRMLSEPDGFLHAQPPERAVFHYEEENKSCSSILHRMVSASLTKQVSLGNQNALRLPDVDLPLIF
jgi:hypothetical protein